MADKSVKQMGKAELETELLGLRKEQFNLRMQAATGQMNKSHLIGEVRKKIARVKTVMQSQVKAS